MFTRLAKFWLAQSRRTAPGPREAFTHSNDNLPGLRRPAAAGRHRFPSPALACHWFDRNGRLECRWQVETYDDAPIADVGEHRMTIGPSGTGFGSSYAALLHRSAGRDLQKLAARAASAC
jgi:hypothetical protein